MASVLRLKSKHSIIFPANCIDYDDSGRWGLNALPHFVHDLSGPCGTVPDHAFDRGADLGLDRHHESASADLGFHLYASAQPGDRHHHLHRMDCAAGAEAPADERRDSHDHTVHGLDDVDDDNLAGAGQFMVPLE